MLGSGSSLALPCRVPRGRGFWILATVRAPGRLGRDAPKGLRLWVGLADADQGSPQSVTPVTVVPGWRGASSPPARDCCLLLPYKGPACAGCTPAAPESTRAFGAGPLPHSSLALSTPRPPRSQAPRGPPHRRCGPFSACLTSRGPDPPPAPGLTPTHPGRAHRSSRLR